MRSLSFILLCFSGYAVAHAGQYTPRHVPPSDTTVPMGARLEAQVIGQGVQIYTCSRKNGPLAWSFIAPEAKLLDPATHEQLGTHSAGPTWQWKDGSAVTGKAVVTQAALEAGSVPWLLLKASPLGKQEGLLSNIVWVRRSETHGGAQPVSGCDDLHLGQSKEIPYTALYTFYSIGTPAGQAR
jgi:hypothetical protein